MDKDYQNLRLKELINGEWGVNCILVQNRAVDIRVLARLLGNKYIEKLDPIAIEIETLAGVALGFGESTLSSEDREFLFKQTSELEVKLAILVQTELIP